MADQTLQVRIEGDLKNLQGALSKAKSEVGDFSKKVGTETKKVEGSFNSMESFAKGALGGIAAAFTIGAIVNVGKAVLDTTATFQKFEAVLTNTLGSSSEAQLALLQIAKFASDTPFAVDELTESFVKLANQGFKPTMNELRSLGDLASSTGKSFKQLSEAIIDAQVGEFERLKEFGIRAAKAGDNVTFTFKGVETQVKSTDEAIRGYILSLGDAEGVSGAMAKISETLGGKLSNLGDNTEQLKLAIGNQSSGVFAASIDWLNTFTSQAIAAAKGVKLLKSEVNAIQFGDEIAQTKNEIDGLIESFLKINPGLTKQEAIQKAVDSTSDSYRKLAGSSNKGSEAVLGTLEAITSYGQELIIASNKSDTLSGSTIKLTSEEKKLQKELENTAKILKARSEQIEAIKTIDPAKQDFDSAFSPKKEDRTGQGKGFEDQIIDFQSTLGKAVDNIQNPIMPAMLFPSAIEFSDYTKKILSEYAKVLDSEIPTFEERLMDLAAGINAILKNSVTEGLIDLGYSIGEAIGAGTNAIGAIGQSLLNSLAKFLGQLGEQLVAYGVAGIAFGKLTAAIALGGPLSIGAGLLAIGAGIALTVISGAISARASRGVSGGGGGGGGGFSGGGGGGGSTFASAQAPSSPAFSSIPVNSDFQSNIIVYGRLDGNDILLSSQRSAQQNKFG